MDLGNMARGQQMKEDQGDYSPIPEGNYTAQVCKSEIVKTGALMVQFEIKGPKYAGRKVAAFFDFNHANQKKQDYDKMKWAEMLQALGYVDLQANPQAQQHGFQDVGAIRSEHDVARQTRPVNIKVVVDEYKGSAKNQIAYFNRIQGQQANNAQQQGYGQPNQVQGSFQQPMNQQQPNYGQEMANQLQQPYGGQPNVQQQPVQQQYATGPQGFDQSGDVPF